MHLQQRPTCLHAQAPEGQVLEIAEGVEAVQVCESQGVTPHLQLHQAVQRTHTPAAGVTHARHGYVDTGIAVQMPTELHEAMQGTHTPAAGGAKVGAGIGLNVVSNAARHNFQASADGHTQVV